MTTKSIVYTLSLISLIFFSCDHDYIRAKGEVTDVAYSFSDYSAIKISDAFNVYVTFSETEQSIVIEANENLHEKIKVRKEGNSLVIKLDARTSVRGNPTMNAYITTNNISDFVISGASKLNLENLWISENGNLKLTGASEVTGEVEVKNLTVTMGGASYADVYGEVDNLNANLTGSSDLKDYDLSVNRLNLELAGASDVSLSVSESIKVTASGASVLNYKGGAVVDKKELSGSSEINNRN